MKGDGVFSFHSGPILFTRQYWFRLVFFSGSGSCTALSEGHLEQTFKAGWPCPMCFSLREDY